MWYDVQSFNWCTVGSWAACSSLCLRLKQIPESWFECISFPFSYQGPYVPYTQTKREEEPLGSIPTHILSQWRECNHYNCITPAFSWSASNNSKPINFSFPSSQENAGGAEACFARVSLEFWFTVAIQVLQVWSSKVQKHYPAFCPQQEVERSVRSWRPLPWQDHMDSWAVSDGGRRSHLRDWKNKNNKKAVRW